MEKDKLMGRGKLTFDWIPNNAERLLDIGCASGEHTLYYLKKCNKVFGVDANKDLIETANERYPQIKFRVANAESLPFAKNYFDVVVMNDVLEHVEDEKKSLDETHRVLKKDGIVILSSPNISNCVARIYHLLTGKMWLFKTFTTDHINPISYWEIERIFKESGFVKCHLIEGVNVVENVSIVTKLSNPASKAIYYLTFKSLDIIHDLVKKENRKSKILFKSFSYITKAQK